MRFSNFFVLTGLSFFPHISASPVKITEHTNPDIDFNLPRSPENKDSLPSIVIGKVVQIFGYQCRGNFYSDSYLKRAATLGARERGTTKIQLYPMMLKPGYYIYPIFPNKNIRWEQGQPEGLDRVVFSPDGNMLYAATAHDHPGMTVESAYQRCFKVKKRLPRPSGELSIFTRFRSPGKSPWDQLNPSSPKPEFNSHLDNNARNHAIYVR